jgi:hypothetical protein
MGRRAGPPSDGDCGAAYNAFIAEPNTPPPAIPSRLCAGNVTPAQAAVASTWVRGDEIFSPPRVKFAKLPVHYAAGAGDESADISTPVR